jgi:ornithine cyclodeaminase/alanine dehydrogenase-like protein (mu-crystallin family)
MKTMILGQEEVIKLLPMDECLDLMEQTFRQLSLYGFGLSVQIDGYNLLEK